MTAFKFLEYVLLVISGLLPVMNPFSTAPLFVALTADMTAQERNRQALLGCVYAFSILVVFLVGGRAIVSFFSISLPGMRIAGGLLISALGFKMLFPPPPKPDISAIRKRDIAFSPIAMPSLAGPGSISIAIATSAKIPDDQVLIGHVIVILGIAITAITAWIVLRGAALMVRFLGPTGIDALTRIFGFLLVCIGVQFVLTGTADFYLPLLHIKG